MVRVSQKASFDSVPEPVKQTKQSNPDLSLTKPYTPRRSKIVATCYVSRNPGYYITNVYSFNCLITILTLTLFITDVESADKRIAGTFKLILTLFTFKIVTSKTLPTISYLTSLDKYQIINIMYLGMCCAWHSIIASVEVSHHFISGQHKLSIHNHLQTLEHWVWWVFEIGLGSKRQETKKFRKLLQSDHVNPEFSRVSKVLSGLGFPFNR